MKRGAFEHQPISAPSRRPTSIGIGIEATFEVKAETGIVKHGERAKCITSGGLKVEEYMENVQLEVELDINQYTGVMNRSNGMSGY